MGTLASGTGPIMISMSLRKIWKTSDSEKSSEKEWVHKGDMAL